MSTTTGSAITGLDGTFDASSLITGLVSAAKAPETALNTKVTNLQTQISSLGSLVTDVQALGTAADALGTASGSQALTASSSDDSTVTGAVTDSAQAGAYVMQIAQLATAQTSASSTFSSNTAGVAGSGSLTLSTASASPVSISFDSTDTLTTIANKINAQASGIAQASVLYDGSSYRLVINSTQTGSAGAVQFSESSGSNLGLSQSSSTIVAAQDAQFTVNGLSVTRSSNTVSDVVPGVTLQLSATTAAGSSATINVGADPSTVATTVQSFVTAYNSLISAVNTQTTYNGSQLGEDSLFGDSAVMGLKAELGTILSNAYTAPDGSQWSGGQLGISLNADGTLSLDSTALEKAVASNPAAVSNFFVGTMSSDGITGTGLSASVDDIVTRYASSQGQLATESTQRTQEISTYQDQIADIDARASDLQTSLTTQFAALATVQAQWSSQASYLTSLQNDSTSSSG